MRQRRLMNQINVVPYIDVMLVLLVIFMVTAPLIQSASIDVPSVGKAAQAPADPLELLVHEDGSLELRDPKSGKQQPLDKAQLVRVIQAAQSEGAPRPVLVAGDKRVRYEAVVAVLDELQRAGLQKIGLLVQNRATR
ncbi:MAG: protein TolR [Rhodocyclaceae bacterium]|nr:protein TolR [Rhodocyclaceae bacterium]